MKFKSQLSANGVAWLQRRIGPALERLGREVTLLFTPESITFVQDTDTTQGIRVHAVFLRDVLFEKYGIKSQNCDKIAFVVNTALFVRVLKSIEEGCERVEIRLVKRRICEGSDIQLPFLNFSSMSARVHVVQDLPLVGRPLQAADLNLVESVLPGGSGEVAESQPHFYLDLLPLLSGACLPALVEKLKHLQDTCLLTITQAGELKLEARTEVMVLGAHHKGLKVMPRELERQHEHGVEDSMALSLERGEGLQVSVRVRDLARGLLSHTTRPDRLLCGIARNKGFVQLGLQYSKDNTGRVDTEVVMYIKLPVQLDN